MKSSIVNGVVSELQRLYFAMYSNKAINAVIYILINLLHLYNKPISVNLLNHFIMPSNHF